jgi:hypothetical protein
MVKVSCPKVICCPAFKVSLLCLLWVFAPAKFFWFLPTGVELAGGMVCLVPMAVAVVLNILCSDMLLPKVSIMYGVVHLDNGPVLWPCIAALLSVTV